MSHVPSGYGRAKEALWEEGTVSVNALRWELDLFEKQQGL